MNLAILSEKRTAGGDKVHKMFMERSSFGEESWEKGWYTAGVLGTEKTNCQGREDRHLPPAVSLGGRSGT